MSIRDLARELYRLECEVATLELRIEQAPNEERTALADELRRLVAERNNYRAIMKSKKEPEPYRRRFR